jgi:hypothetical protein
MLDDPQLGRELFRLLVEVDQAVTCRVAAEGCPVCGGPLHRGDYVRKPRGALVVPAGEAFARRFSLCCGREGCRKRALPPSVRFLGRRVYLGAVVILASVVALARRVLGPVSTPPRPSKKPAGIAPLLRELMAEYAATGLPPAYLPKNSWPTLMRRFDSMITRLLSLYSIKFRPFIPDVPVEALYTPPPVDTFARRVELTIADGGFAMITGDPGTGKTVAMRLLAERLRTLPNVVVGTIEHPQSRTSDFYRELGDLFGIPSSATTGGPASRPSASAGASTSLPRSCAPC